MGLTAADVEQAHRGIGHADELVGQRRLLYRTVIELLAGVERAAATTDDVLDSPAVRGHIGAVLAGSTVIRSDRLLPTDALVAEGCAIDIHGYSLRIATSDVARTELSGVLSRIEAELGRHGDDECVLQILGPEDPRFPDAFRLVADGGRLVMELVPQLATDLLAHIAVVAVLVSTGTGRLGSASAREYPGVVLLPEPHAPLEVAEAIVHEGAHQKFFDLALTHRILGAKAHQAPRYVPSWSGSGAPSWPLEQAFAAFHAYCCLDVLARSVTAAADLALHPYSLLPFAHARSMEIGGWLRRQGAFLGSDGHTLIAELTGCAPDEPPASEPVDAAALASSGRASVVRAMGSRTLIAVRAEPMELAWVLTEGHDARA